MPVVLSTASLIPPFLLEVGEHYSWDEKENCPSHGIPVLPGYLWKIMEVHAIDPSDEGQRQENS
jgi:hypothetical protein